MVQKEPRKRRRGRPRSYEPGQALLQALEAFWTTGYSATSLDALSDATGLNRPSLYAAFGDKQALYLKTLEAYRAQAEADMRQALDPARPLREGLLALFRRAIALYLSGEGGARGCYLIGTAATEAVDNAVVRGVLLASLQDFDAAFEARLRLARRRGELPRGADTLMLARLASAIMHSIAVRARAGESRAVLEAMAQSGVEQICGRPQGTARPRRSSSKK